MIKYKSIQLIHLKFWHYKYFSGTAGINSWKSNGMSEENTESITKSESLFVPGFVGYYVLQDKILIDTV